ncbi:molybdate ABC transporter permease subunit [Natronoflexus pectinivorans]|uniref:Molybdenum transport system permease n=1 Tax=Natronoflexus pectinivorans TaxID=682526 RepID=A0A4V2RVX2_9BACT|nr:molybdate ABC transporter permease subunit [Natronoflexus pectinivorans]TCO06024.1 molybdate transport system permease protein [Natronoflexus pectinivorans]
MSTPFTETLILTAKLAIYTTVILLVIGMPISYFLAFSRFRFKPVVEALVSMPLVLPPSVIGYYILVAYSPNYWFGSFLSDVFDVHLAFSFEGILIASVVFSVPFMVQPLTNGLRGIPVNLREASYTLGKSKAETFFRVLIPNIKPSLITAIALTFAHCIGEFGIILMVGGNIPGETRVASIAIYDEVQGLNFDMANRYALTLFLISFVILTLIYTINRRSKTWKMM